MYPELGEVVSDSLQDRLERIGRYHGDTPKNGRLYRTIVNRFWDRLLGRGIVAPVDEMDNIPWSQDLLDWLASDFIEHGYDFHHLLTRIMTSQAYQIPAVSYPSPEYLNSSEFVFRGPTVRRLTAEQFVDAFGQVIAPIYHGIAFDPDDRKINAKWIWHEEIKVDRRVLPDPGSRLFRKTFAVESSQAIQRADLLVTADHSFQFYLNGRKLASGDDWREVQQLEVPVDLLEKKNTIALKGFNDGVIPNPAGVLLSLRIQYADSSFQFVHSDKTWKSTNDTLQQNWKERTFDDSNWKNAWQAGSFQRSYWGGLLDFDFQADTVKRAFARAAIVQQDQFMKTLGRPVRENVVTQRDKEATLLQALMLTNSAFFHERINQGATTLINQTEGESDQIIHQLFQNILGRAPTRKEEKILLKALKSDEQEYVLEDIIWTLVMLPEFWLI